MGIDLGTSSLKTLIMDDGGTVLSVSAKDYQFSSPHTGYAEQDPNGWWDACCQTIKEALAVGNVSPHRVKGVGFSGQMHGTVLLDAHYNPIRPAILHCDTRSAKQVEYVKEKLGKDKIIQLLMNPIYTGFMLPTLLWVKEQEPEHFEKIQYVMLPKDYLKFKLTGEVSSDYSDASATLLFDIQNLTWSEEIRKGFDIPKDIFPRCYTTPAHTGTVCKKASEETGLCTNTAVVAGGGDQVMQGIGNGISQVGGVSVNIGSSGQVSFQSHVPIVNPNLSTNTFCGFDTGRWFTMGAVMCAGLSLKWCNSLLNQRDYAALDEQVAKVQPGSGGLIYLPYLNGERTPHMNPNISGQFLGLNINTGRGEFTRAVMEGVTYSLKQCMEVCEDLGLTTQYMVASGGGARSKPWLQIQADVFNKPLRVAKVSEQAALGAAIAAGVGAGVYQNIGEGCEQVVHYCDEIIQPIPLNHTVYMDYYQLYKEVFAASREVLESLTVMGRKL